MYSEALPLGGYRGGVLRRGSAGSIPCHQVMSAMSYRDCTIGPSYWAYCDLAESVERTYHHLDIDAVLDVVGTHDGHMSVNDHVLGMEGAH